MLQWKMALLLQGFQIFLGLQSLTLQYFTYCIHHNHYLLSVYYESKTTEEIMKENNSVNPDGMSQQGIGDIVGMVAKVGVKTCALKSLRFLNVIGQTGQLP